jgi:sister chromatid cohesion protein PDS5
LAETKSIILLTDVDNADALILPLFTICFDIVSGSFKGSTGGEIERAIEYNMTNLLVVVIDEVAVLPQEVVDVILSQFLRVDPRSSQHAPGKSKKDGEVQDDKQGNLLLKDYPAAYNMAKAICTTCPEKMTSQISQYFNNVIVDASASRETSAHPKHGARRISNLDESDDEAEDVKELSKAHQLIRELWRACPDVLQNVVPQLEAELSAESVSLRLLATETLGDVAAGIGVSGPPPPAQVDPAAYPPASILHAGQPFSGLNRLLVPMSPKPFFSTHAAAYSSFLSRRLDKSPSVRAAWATAVGRILLTSAGGIGFDDGEDTKLFTGLAQTLGDADEKVRLSSIKVIASFSFADAVNRFGPNGGIERHGSVMSALAERIKDRKHAVREQAARVLARLWGVASNDIQEGTEKVVSTLGQIPLRILDSVYTGDPDIQVLVERVTFEILLPVTFPPIKARSKQEKSQGKEKEGGSQDEDAADPNLIRVQRILTLVKSLDDRAKKVFFMMQNRQVVFAKLMAAYLKACEEYNGGVVEGDAENIKTQLTKLIDAISKALPESARVSTDLWKFAKMHDRRNYQLIRYAMSAENDYRTVTNAIKELSKRIRDGPSAAVSLLDTITPILYRCSLLVYNRSHVPAIMKISRTDDYSLGEVAYEMLKEISTHNPEVLGTHVQEMCKDLETHAPTADTAEQPSAADTLKACAAFARKFPTEISKDRKFLLAMTNYALYGRTPQAAKHAVSIIMAAADKKEMYAKDLIRKATKDCKYTSPHFLTRLATISQICLLAPSAANSESDAIAKVALDDTLLSNRAPSTKAETYSWSNTPDEETLAKEWALKILVNRCRSEQDSVDSVGLREVVSPLYSILSKLIVDEGELLPSKDTPSRQKSRLRLTAARLLLKLCSHLRACEALVTPSIFNATALVALDRLLPVRTGFVNQLKKYLSQNRLNQRWYTVLFLLAYEPDTDLQSSTVTWLKSRAQAFLRHRQQPQSSNKSSHDNVMELLFARLLSLLAHHPDFPEKDTEDYHPDLVDYSKYICFYLSTIANEDNLSLVFHIAQRVKQTKDAVSADSREASDRLYILSDLAQATIRNYADVLSHQKGHAANVNILQTWPGKLRLPSALFAALPNHTVAQEIADKNFLPEEVANDLERLVKAYMKPSKGGTGHGLKTTEKKRKSDWKDDDVSEDGKPAKRPKKTTALPVRKASTVAKTPKIQKKRKSDENPSSELPSRKSTRTSNAATVSYADRDSDEDDAEMLEVEKASAKKSRAKAERSTSCMENPDKAKGGSEQLGEDEKENEIQDPDDEVGDNADVDEMDATLSSREASSSPLRAKTNGTTKKGKQDTSSKTKGTRSTAIPRNTSGKAVVQKSLATKKKATPLKKANEPVANARETRRTRATA